MRGFCQESRLGKTCCLLLTGSLVVVGALFLLAPRAVEYENHVQLNVAKNPQNLGAKNINLVISEGDNGSDLVPEEDVVDKAKDVKEQNDSETSAKTNEGDGQAGSSLFKKLDDLLAGDDKSRLKALKLCEDNYRKYKKDPQFMWRYVCATYLKSKMEGAKNNLDNQKKISYLAKNRAEEALKLTDNDGHVHKWYALALGNAVEYESLKDQIKLGFVFRDHLQKAIKLLPDDPTLYYLLGRWCYRVYMLSWWERKLAATLLADPPTATIEDTLAYFLKSDKLRVKQGLKNKDGKLKDNYLYVAKSYIEMKNNKLAVTYLKKANGLPNKSHDDEVSQKEVKKLLGQYA